MKLPEQIDTTKLAEYQDLVLTRTDWSPSEAREHLRHFNQWAPMLSRLPVSNLLIRQELIAGGLNRIAGLPMGYDAYAAAEEMFNDLTRNGYWRESDDYLEYTALAVEWYSSVIGVPAYLLLEIEQMRANYDLLTAPDGTRPLPESRARRTPVRANLPNFVSNPSYIVKRWPSGAYLLVALDTDPEPRHNYHAHLAAGYFAFYGVTHHAPVSIEMPDGTGRIDPFPRMSRAVYGWVVRCKAYTSFNMQESFTSSAFAGLLPSGALPPTWRVKPPRVTVKHIDQGVRIRWTGCTLFPVTREITWAEGVVRVCDKWALVRSSKREWRV